MRGLWFLPLMIATAGIVGSSPALAEKPADFWQTPTIKDYGKIHYLADSAYKPSPDQTYKIVFTMTTPPKSADQVNPGLNRLARTVNLYVAAGVPLDHLKFVAVASGAATSLILDDAHYQKAYKMNNPNLPLIRKLRDAGIDVAVCAQAVAEHDYEYEWVDKSVTLALSALTTVTTLEHDGYSLMPL